MSSRSRYASRAARHHAAERRRVQKAAFDKAVREEQTDMVVLGDRLLGTMVDSLVERDRMANAADAARLEGIYDILKRCESDVAVTTSNGMKPWSQSQTARRVATSEVALALKIPEPTATSLIEDSRFLIERLPETMNRIRVGEFSLRHARGIVDHARDLPDELVAEFEAAVLPLASTLTFAKFNKKARVLKERLDASTIEERHAKSMADRERYFLPDKNGMGWLQIYTSAHLGMAAINRTDEMAKVTAAQPYEDRTLTQLRADLTMDLLLDGSIEGRFETTIRPSVTVTVPLRTMLGLKNRDGSIDLPTLEGYGPIDVATARRLAAASKSWLSVFTTPDGSAITSVGRNRRVPASLRTLLRLIDGTCRKPGCNRPAVHCDLDHAEEFQHGGMTAHDNLEHLCAKHHAEKHHTDVRVEHLPNGNIRWTLPSGRQYESEPDRRYIGPGWAAA